MKVFVLEAAQVCTVSGSSAEVSALSTSPAFAWGLSRTLPPGHAPATWPRPPKTALQGLSAVLGEFY